MHYSFQMSENNALALFSVFKCSSQRSRHSLIHPIKCMMINLSAFNLDMSYSQLKSYKCAEDICITGSCDHQLHFPLT